MTTHSNILAWDIPWTEELGGLQSMGSQGWTRPSTHALRKCSAFNAEQLLDSSSGRGLRWCTVYFSPKAGSVLVFSLLLANRVHRQ